MALVLRQPESMHVTLREMMNDRAHGRHADDWKPRIWPELVGTLAVSRHRLDVAVRLFGVAIGVRKEFGELLTAQLGLRLGQEEACAAAHAAAQEPPLDVEWRLGETMSLEAALEFAACFLEEEAAR